MKRAIVLAFTAMAISFVGLLVLRFLRDPIRESNFDLIRVGASEKEVETMLGRPADRECHPWDGVEEVANEDGPLARTDVEWEKTWQARSGAAIVIRFDKGERVCGKQFWQKPNFDGLPPARWSLEWLRFWEWL